MNAKSDFKKVDYTKMFHVLDFILRTQTTVDIDSFLTPFNKWSLSLRLSSTEIQEALDTLISRGYLKFDGKVGKHKLTKLSTTLRNK